MDFISKIMNESYAKEILLWKYDTPYDFYNNELNDEALAELLNGDYVAIVDETNQLFGFFCTGISSQVPAGIQHDAYSVEMIDIGLGMKPEFTGKGYGTEFFTFILQSIQDLHGKELPLRLTVATFNKRARNLYEKFGFVENVSFYLNDTEFTTMIRLHG
jgi:[ribosomal protein S18]-alanine N-acetyltransferase